MAKNTPLKMYVLVPQKIRRKCQESQEEFCTQIAYILQVLLHLKIPKLEIIDHGCDFCRNSNQFNQNQRKHYGAISKDCWMTTYIFNIK